MSTISLYETILVISTAAVFFVYHLHLYLKVHRAPLTTAIGITNHARHMWVEGTIRDNRDILAVQTLRNQVMAATFFASTAILISLGSFSAAFRPGVFMEVSHALNLLGTKTETLWMFKLMLLGILFFIAWIARRNQRLTSICSTWRSTSWRGFSRNEKQPKASLRGR